MFSLVQRIDREEDLPALAQRLLREMPTGVWALRGPMGAGKTALCRAVCAELGVVDGVGSPSFGLVHEYRDTAGQPIYHLDWYRLEGVEAVRDLGVEELFDSGALCLVEWPERAEALLPEHRMEIALEFEEEQPDTVVSAARIFTVYRL